MCIWRTTEIVVKPIDNVDNAFAWDEGEGDRTRDWRLKPHRRYFFAQAGCEGLAMHDRIEPVFEWFTIVRPTNGPFDLGCVPFFPFISSSNQRTIGQFFRTASLLSVSRRDCNRTSSSFSS